MSIRWIHQAVDEDGYDLDYRLMTLKDIWQTCLRKDKRFTYAALASYVESKGYRPVAVDDKQVFYYACKIRKSEAYSTGLSFTILTGEMFYERIYQPFGSDEFLIHSPEVPRPSRILAVDTLHDDDADEGDSPARHRSKSLIAKFLGH